ncbi:MAG: HAD hydrolase-like protein [Patescibacteria group bacterium]
MKPSNRLVLFDFDGVVVDSVSSVYLTVIDILEEAGVLAGNLPDFQTFLQTVSLPPDGFYHRYGINWSAELSTQFWDIMPLYEALDGEYLGMRPMVAELRRRGFRTAIVSGGQSVYVNRRLDQLCLRGLFDAVYTGAADKTEVLNLVCRRLTATPERTHFIGDFQSDMRDGCAAGVIPIGFTGGHDFMIPVLTAAGAQVCVDEPEELLAIISD